MIKVFIGYDSRVPIIYYVASSSILTRASSPVTISPIMLDQLNGVFTREKNALQSTEFSFSRFLTPYLCDFNGWALYMDNDIVCKEDIAKLWELRDDRYAVMCVKHDYEVESEMKFLGEKQTRYEKKNWSSIMLFNCTKCKALTPDYVNTATGLQLHQFKWLESEDLIGEIPKEWNYLVGVYPASGVPSLIHYTDGGPYYNDYKDVDFAEEWLDEYTSLVTWEKE
jgi:hypothetical protein